MRTEGKAGGFHVKAFAGTRTVLFAINCEESKRNGLRGFALKRGVGGSNAEPKWLRSLKVFQSVVPDPKNARDPRFPDRPMRFYTDKHPVQSFLWGDYGAEPDTEYAYTIVPMYGDPGNLRPATPVPLAIRTEKEFANGHGVWFNRGAIASQKFSEEFGNKAPSNADDPDDEEVKWLSRGLLKACLTFIDDTPRGDGLRVAAYEFTYQPILKALKSAIDRGVDVQIVYHDTTKEEGKGEKRKNEDAMERAGLPINDGKVTFRRSKPKIPHNKFIVRLAAGKRPTEVWTGSTNFTSSGFLGQTNVGHRVQDEATAAQYLEYWHLLKPDPDLEKARTGTMLLTPNPPSVIERGAIVRIFSPRPKSDLLKWYAERIEDAAASVMFTAAFGVAKQLVPALVKPRRLMRFLLMEKPAAKALAVDLKKDKKHLIPSYGVPLGQLYTFKNGKPTTRKKIKGFELEKWFMEEDHYRRANDGFVFFVHTKFLLVDPFSDDPLVCSGSANFSSNSLLQNDENMLLIRGDKRVADIYMTEFDRVFRHFYFRDIANELHGDGKDEKAKFLDETDEWSESYFWKDGFKSLRRQMFFASPGVTWVGNAQKRQQSGKKSGAAARRTAKTKAKKAAKKKI